MARLLPRAASSLVALIAIGQRNSQAFSPIYRPSLFPSTSSVAATSTVLTMSTKRILVPIGEGSEEIETCAITDTLTRFGAEVTVASVMKGELLCKMSRGIKVMADMSIEDAAKVDNWDLIVLPGGMPGATHLRDSEVLISILNKQKKEDKLYGAICAAPAVVLAAKDLIVDGSTCYPAPGFREQLTNPSDDNVVVIGKVTTSKGPGTALEFALSLGEQLFGKEARDKIQKEMLV